MLFVHESPRPISMWMKNTYIPLDMVFIDGRGRIQQIVAHTKPHSLDIIRSDATGARGAGDRAVVRRSASGCTRASA